MAGIRRVDSTTYYDILPSLAHECGDIWRSLPAFGTLGQQSCCGIVITPACDLSWQKSDTLTYLPIIPIRTYFSLDAALPALVERLTSALEAIPFETGVDWAENSYTVPPDEVMIKIEKEIIDYREIQQRSKKLNITIDRALACLSVLREIKSGHIGNIDSIKLQSVFGSEWKKIKEKIVCNSYSPALHFLPSDRQNRIFSAIPDHSVVLFRYPITVPVKILSCAQENLGAAWSHNLDLMGLAPSLRAAFGDERPIKLASLRPAFLSDLLTRYSALYNRVGSPDFSPQTVETYVNEVDG